jgi:hypothetical protein
LRDDDCEPQVSQQPNMGVLAIWFAILALHTDWLPWSVAQPPNKAAHVIRIKGKSRAQNVQRQHELRGMFIEVEKDHGVSGAMNNFTATENCQWTIFDLGSPCPFLATSSLLVSSGSDSSPVTYVHFTKSCGRWKQSKEQDME